MKIAILSRKPELYSTQALADAAKDRGHNVRIIDPLRCYMNITSNRPSISYKGEKLQDIDAVIPRIGASITFYGTAVVRQFEMMGVYCVNESVAITRSRDKLRSLQLLARKGIGLPVTGFSHSTAYTEDLIEMVGGAPLVVKLLEGTQGIGVVLCENKAAAESVIEAFRGLKTNILVQEFIKEADGADIRCFVVGDKVVATMMRKGKEGEFRSNPAPRRQCQENPHHAGRAFHCRTFEQNHGAQCGWRGHPALQPRPCGHGSQLLARTGGHSERHRQRRG